MVRKLIREKLLEKKLSMKEASLRMGHAHSYLFIFLKRGIPRELHERDRESLAPILGVTPDELRGPSVPLPRRNYGKNVTNLVASDSEPTYAGVPLSQITAGQRTIGSELDLPVFGTGSGDFEGGYPLTEVAVDWAIRPPMLSKVRDAYALIVPRDVMAPAMKAGTVAMINPHLPPRAGDFCIWRSEREGVTYAKGGEYLGETETSWRVRHYNPSRDFSLKKADWTVCHRIIGAYFS